jgi:hypothetical protein
VWGRAAEFTNDTGYFVWAAVATTWVVGTAVWASVAGSRAALAVK